MKNQRVNVKSHLASQLSEQQAGSLSLEVVIELYIWEALVLDAGHIVHYANMATFYVEPSSLCSMFLSNIGYNVKSH